MMQEVKTELKWFAVYLGLVYVLPCKKCLIQYVCKTVDEFRHKWKNNYKNNSRNYDCNQPRMWLLITFIDKTDPSDPLKR